MGRLRITLWNRAVAALCALALGLVAHAHHPAEADARLSDPQIAAYLAVGGSLADLCLSGDDGQGPLAQADCPACTIAKTMALAPACLAPVGQVAAADRLAVRPDAVLWSGQGPRAPPARGPPPVLTI